MVPPARAALGAIVVLPLLLAPAAAARANLCFTAHGKGELYCREPPVSGKPLAVSTRASRRSGRATPL